MDFKLFVILSESGLYMTNDSSKFSPFLRDAVIVDLHLASIMCETHSNLDAMLYSEAPTYAPSASCWKTIMSDIEKRLDTLEKKLDNR